MRDERALRPNPDAATSDDVTQRRLIAWIERNFNEEPVERLTILVRLFARTARRVLIFHEVVSPTKESRENISTTSKNP